MSQVLLSALVVLALLACPLHMWWMHRRGRRAICCPAPTDERPMDIATLRERRRQLDAQLAELELGAPPPQRH